MTTIGNYSVAIGLAADGLIQGGILARKEIGLLNQTIRSVVDPSEKLARQFDVVESALKKGAISEETATAIKERLRLKVNELTAALEKQAAANQKASIVTARIVEPQKVDQVQDPITSSFLAKLTPAALAATGLAAAYKAVGTAKDFAAQSLMKFAEIEKTTASFEVLTGSALKAKDMLGEIRNLASRGLSMSALNQAAATMLSFNVATRDVIPALTQIGEITRGDTERLKMMSLAFAQSAAAGRLMGQDLLQMINAGFNPLQEISRQTGRSLVDLRKDMENGLITFDMVRNAFASATDEGGKYNGMLDKMAETTGGALNQLTAKWERFQIAVGQNLAGATRGGSTILADLLDQATTLSERLGIVQDGLNELKIAGEVKGSTAIMASTQAAYNQLSQNNPSLQFLGFIERALVSSAALSDDIEVRMRAIERLKEQGYASSEMLEQLSLDKAVKAYDKRMEMEKDLAAVEQDRIRKSKQLTTSKEQEAANKRFDTMFSSLTQQLEKLKEGKAAALEMKAAMAGFSPDQQKTIAGLAREIESIERRNKAEKERTAEAKKQNTLLEQNTREAEQLTNRLFNSPTDRLRRNLAEISKLQEVRALTPFEADRARREAVKDSVEKIKIETPKAMDVNSQQGADWLANWRNSVSADKAKENQAQINVLNAIKAQQQETNRKLDKLVEVQPRNVR